MRGGGERRGAVSCHLTTWFQRGSNRLSSRRRCCSEPSRDGEMKGGGGPALGWADPSDPESVTPFTKLQSGVPVWLFAVILVEEGREGSCFFSPCILSLWLLPLLVLLSPLATAERWGRKTPCSSEPRKGGLRTCLREFDIIMVSRVLIPLFPPFSTMAEIKSTERHGTSPWWS